jgi:hypothetical protein
MDGDAEQTDAFPSATHVLRRRALNRAAQCSRSTGKPNFSIAISSIEDRGTSACGSAHRSSRDLAANPQNQTIPQRRGKPHALCPFCAAHQ